MISYTIGLISLKTNQRVRHILLDGDGFVAGYIFDLKHNHGWTDRTQVDQKTSMTFHFDKEDEGL